MESVFFVIWKIFLWCFGGMDKLFITLNALVVAYISTTILCGMAERKILRYLPIKKVAAIMAIYIVVGVANVLDNTLLTESNSLRAIAIFTYCFFLGRHICQNLTLLGLPIPEALKELLLGKNNKSLYQHKNG